MHPLDFALIASMFFSTTYGWGENNCGDIGKPQTCAEGAITASGVPLSYKLPIVAVAAPTKLRMKAYWVKMRIKGKAKCKWLLLADKMNPRYIGKRGFDLTPPALSKLGVRPSSTWSGHVELCLDQRNFFKPYRRSK